MPSFSIRHHFAELKNSILPNRVPSPENARGYRKTTRITIIATVTLASFAGGLSAQNPGPSLSLEEARTMALKNHPQILASQALSLRADQVTREVRSAYYPALNGEVTGAQAN